MSEISRTQNGFFPVLLVPSLRARFHFMCQCQTLLPLSKQYFLVQVLSEKCLVYCFCPSRKSGYACSLGFNLYRFLLLLQCFCLYELQLQQSKQPALVQHACFSVSTAATKIIFKFGDIYGVRVSLPLFLLAI